MKIKLLLVFLVASGGLCAQSIYLKTGLNNTTYNYKSTTGEKNKTFQSDLGNAYELGYRFPLLDRARFFYDVGFVLNEYNAVVGEADASIKWKTGYVGIQSTIIYTIVESDYFSIDIKGGGGLNTILYGKEDIDGIVYDLRNNSDFNGAVFHVLLGLQGNLKASEYCHLSIGYNYSNTINTLQKPQKFSVETSQIMFGIHFTAL
jgi:hypothetical protein